MTPIERSYEWFNKLDKATQDSLRADVGNALEQIRTMFKDKSITREQVEIILADKDENVKKRELLESNISDLERIISEKQAELATAKKKLKLLSFVTNIGFDERADRAIVMKKMEANRLAEIAKLNAVKAAVEEQQRLIAEQANIPLDDVKSVLSETPKKKRKQPIKG